MSKEIKFEVKETLGTVGEDKKLQVINWNNKGDKLDLRSWWEDKNGEEKCGKGITLTDDEARELVDLLSAYLEKKEG